MTMSRKVADCRRIPSESNCSLTLIGDEQEVLDEAEAHAVRVHGDTGGPELRELIRKGLEDEDAFERRVAKETTPVGDVSYAV
jgi:hypothetical protein